MKKWAVLVVGIAFIFSSGAWAEGPKIAYVDLQREKNEKQKVIEEKERQIDALKAEIEAKKTVLSEEALQKKQEDLDRLMRDLKRFVQDANEELQKKQQQYTNKILSELVQVVQELGKQEGYTFIFERVPAVLLYVDEGLDLTDEIIKIYDEKYQKEKEK